MYNCRTLTEWIAAKCRTVVTFVLRSLQKAAPKRGLLQDVCFSDVVGSSVNVARSCGSIMQTIMFPTNLTKLHVANHHVLAVCAWCSCPSCPSQSCLMGKCAHAMLIGCWFLQDAMLVSIYTETSSSREGLHVNISRSSDSRSYIVSSSGGGGGDNSRSGVGWLS